jgi:hypothetical protein
VYCANLLGNAGRNTIIGPKLVNVDVSATKNFPITRISETFNVQFRAEIFNVFNHTNFAPPEPLNGAGIFDQDGVVIANGEMDNLATQPRDVQFALTAPILDGRSGRHGSYFLVTKPGYKIHRT